MTTKAVTPRQRMIEDMNARTLGAHSQRSHIYSCKRLAGFLKRSPETAICEDLRLFQLHLAETGMSICNRNRIMTGVGFLFRMTLRRLDLCAEIYHLREPQKIPQVMSPDEMRRLLAVTSSLKVRVLLSLGYGCGLRCDTLVQLCVRHVLCWPAFPLVSALGSTGSAAVDSTADRSAAASAVLFVGFTATMAGSDFSCPCIIGYGSSPSRCGPSLSPTLTAGRETSQLPMRSFCT